MDIDNQTDSSTQTTQHGVDDCPVVDPEVATLPLSLFIVMCALALLGVLYAGAVLIFNIVWQKDKVIKMTSPNINVVTLVGVIVAYSAMVLMGIDSRWVTLDTMAALLQATTYVLAISFTIVFGTVFAKSWRIFMVFKNINFNGKNTRDEHLLLVVLVLIIVDLIILLTWTFVDPIHCSSKVLLTQGENCTVLDAGIRIDECTSDLLGVWIGVTYFYKTLLLLIGLFFTWQTRHVTLPSLRDTRQLYIVVYTVAVLALVSLPAVLVQNTGREVRYAVGALCVWFTLTTTVTLLYLPKIILLRREQSRSSSPDAAKFMFSESMKRTQEAIRKCTMCFCGEAISEEDRYAQEVLSTEIDTLKRTIKEKDATIRELTDRLMYGAEKFQEYLSSPSQQNVLYAMYKKKAWRTRSQPAVPYKERDRMRDYRLGRFYENMDADTSMDRRASFTISQCSSDQTLDAPQQQQSVREAELPTLTFLQNASACDRAPRSNGYGVHSQPEVTSYDGMRLQPLPEYGCEISHGATPTYYGNSSPLGAGHSPEHDSVIDHSPSSDLSDRGSDQPDKCRAARAQFRHRQGSCPIDLDAMEKDAAASTAKQLRWSSVKTKRPPYGQSDISMGGQSEYEPYRTRHVSGVSVSQI